MRLAVELYGTVLGYLGGSDSRSFDFLPTEEGISRFGLNSSALSVVLPLTLRMPRHHAGRRRNWFAELLPEGDQLDHMLALGSLRRGDILGFLARFGRDVAGSVQLWDVDDPTEPPTPQKDPVSEHEIRQMLEDPMATPLGNRPSLGKSSLQGVQPKIVLAHQAGTWHQCLGGYPSTHILKPEVRRRPSLIFDEEYGLRLARRLGLCSFRAEMLQFGGLSTLVVERYDRTAGARIHQEDLSQALGASSNEKYQEWGGVVSLRRCAEILDRIGRRADMLQLARMVIFAAGIGNLDMHTKNIGLLHPESGETMLAPAYDTVPMIQYSDSDGRMALAINKKYQHAQLRTADLNAEFRAWGLRRSEELVDRTLDELEGALTEEAPQDGASEDLDAHIRSLIRQLRGL